MVGLVGIIILLFYFGYVALRASVIGKYVGLARDFIAPSQNELVGQNNINILLMGKGGAGHDAPDLTDTMIVVSVDTTKKQVSLISIPRDIWMDDLKAKINTAYYYGNQKKSGGGMVLARSIVEEVLGIQINYVAIVDFNVFKEVIDTIGGITVDVKNGFVDKQFPIAGKENDLCGGDPTFACRYETIEFKSGVQTMDGDTALKFVRSRHAVGDEGTDLAREARQQLVIHAIIAKIATAGVILSYPKMSGLVNIVVRNIETDVKPEIAATVARYVFDARGNVKSYSIPADLLISPPPSSKYLNQYVFIPKKGISDWSDVQKWVSEILKN